MNIDELKKAHHHCNDTKKEFYKSKVVGCFCCQKVFSPSEITCWISGSFCPECPHCGIDSLIGDSSGFKITPYFLKQMHDYWFKKITKENL